MKTFRNILLIILGTMLALILGLQAFVNSRWAGRIVAKYAAPYVDGEIGWSRIRLSFLRNFPEVRLTVDGLSVTYPHGKFAEYDNPTVNHALLDAGRGSEVDTLAAMDRMTAAVNVWKFLRNKEIVSKKISFEGLRAYAHQYSPDAANWDVILIPESSDTTDSPTTIPWVRLHDASVSNPRIVYTDQQGSIFADLAFDELSLGGALRMVEDVVELDKVKLSLSNLAAAGGMGVYGHRTMIDASGRLQLSADLDGLYDGEEYPQVAAEMQLSDAQAYYAPMRLPLSLAMDMEAEVDPSRYVKAVVRSLSAGTDGLDIEADGSAEDLLGPDPAYRLAASGSAQLASLLRFVPADLGIGSASGNLRMKLIAAARQSELNAYHFKDASIRGQIDGDRVFVTMPSDTLDAKLFKPELRLESNSEGIDMDIDVDSLYFNLGSSLAARVRNMSNCGQITKVESRGQLTPRLDLHTNCSGVFARLGTNRFLAKDARIDLGAQKRVRPQRRGMRAPGDSASRAHRGMRELRDTTLASHDISIALDSTLMAWFNAWEPSGNIKIERGIVASPAMPLRTRIQGLDGNFDGNHLDLDSLRVICGTSDLAMRGRIQGIRGFLRGRGTLGADVRMLARRLNVNEMLAALQAGSVDRADTVSVASEADESFVIDTLENASIDESGIPLIIVPGNVNASISLEAEQIDYTDISISPAKSTLKLKDRTVQLTDTDIRTNVGTIGLEAYYSTKSRNDLKAGLDMKLSDIDAYGIIHMLPSVDSLMPLLKSFKGKLGMELSATTQVDTNMNIIIPTLDGVVRISGEDLLVEDAGDLKKITRLLMFKNKDIGQIQDMSVDAVVHDGKLELFPFELAVDRYKLALRGMQGIDKSMYYHVSILKSPLPIRFGINIFGTLDKWKFSLGLPKYRDGKVPVFTSQLDNVQVNIAQSIRDIFSRGVDEVQKYNRQNVGHLGQSAGEAASSSSSEQDDAAEMAKVDAYFFDLQNEEWERSLYEEVDAVLEESYSETAKLMKEYGALMYDASVNRKIERVRRKAEKKK